MKWVYQKNNTLVHEAGKTLRHKIVPAAYLIPVWQGKILLSRRFQTGYEDGKYSLIAGHVESGETFTQCVAREAKEEAGIIVQPENLEMVHAMCRNAGQDNERMDLYFVTTEWQGKIKNCEPHKCDDLAWCDIDQLPENTISYIVQAIRAVNDEIYYSECGW